MDKNLQWRDPSISSNLGACRINNDSRTRQNDTTTDARSSNSNFFTVEPVESTSSTSASSSASFHGVLSEPGPFSRQHPSTNYFSYENSPAVANASVPISSSGHVTFPGCISNGSFFFQPNIAWWNGHSNNLPYPQLVNTGSGAMNHNANGTTLPNEILPTQNYQGITPVELNKLISEGDWNRRTLKKIILLDCRTPKSFSRKRINFKQNFNITPFHIDTNCDRFPSREAAVKMILENCVELLGIINEPGYYTHIILLDETSTINVMSLPIKYLYMALTKWNESTKTKIKVLQGGIWEFSKQFPNMIIPRLNMTSFPPSSLPVQLSETLTDLILILPDATPEVKLIMQGLTTHIYNLDNAIEITTELIRLRGKLKSFEKVKSILLKEHEKKLVKKLEAQIPEEVKCPVCLEIYTGEIFQCGNGHCICAGCSGRLHSCPECRQPCNMESFTTVGVGRVRNRALEALMGNAFKVHCQCGETLMSKDAKFHVKRCTVGARQIQEVVKIEEKIGALREYIRGVNEKLDQVNQQIMSAEQQWNYRFGEQNTIPVDYKNIFEKINGRKVVLSSLNVSLMSSIFFNDEPALKQGTAQGTVQETAQGTPPQIYYL